MAPWNISARHQRSHHWHVLAWVLILTATLPYFVRRRAPATVFVVSLSATAALLFAGYTAGALPWVILVGAYTVAAYRPALVIVGSAALAAALLIALLVADVRGFGVGEFVAGASAYGAAMLLGWAMQTRRDRIDAFAGERQEAARRAVADEQLRIAQELHDIVGHSLGVIAVQAGVGMHTIDSDPDEARRSLENISRISRTSLTDIRRLLGMMRTADGNPTYTPAPGLGDLTRLIDDVTRAGLSIDLAIHGDMTEVPAGVALTAYRIVQESLTNTLRHARAHRAQVTVANGSEVLEIDVADDGRGGNGAPVRGHGLVGMQERVSVYGGTFAAGPDARGGFRVVARLPYGEPIP